jgi:hypothetical protein
MKVVLLFFGLAGATVLVWHSFEASGDEIYLRLESALFETLFF